MEEKKKVSPTFRKDPGLIFTTDRGQSKTVDLECTRGKRSSCHVMVMVTTLLTLHPRHVKPNIVALFPPQAFKNNSLV